MKTLVILSFLTISINLAAQSRWNDSTYSPDNFDIFNKAQKNKQEKKLASGDTSSKKEKNVYTIVLPVVGYNPFTGFILGVAGTSSFKLGPDKNKTRLSSIVPSYTWTTNNISAFRVNSSLFTNDDQYYIFNSILLSSAPQNTYGVGGNTLDAWETSIKPATAKVVLRGYKRVYKQLFLGLNINYDNKYKIENVTGKDMQAIIDQGRASGKEANLVQQELNREFGDFSSYWNEQGISQDGFQDSYQNNMSSEELQKTYYSTPFDQYLFGTTGSYVYSGLGINALWDSRDNINSSYKGSYINFLLNTYPEWFGSTYESTQMYLDVRKFFPLKKNNTMILGFWGLANITWGEVPYSNLPRIGGDDWYASGRGYTAGRFIGPGLAYLEAEYRINIKNWFGLTTFLNATSVMEENRSFKYVNPAGGIGFRIKALKKSRANICLDYGIGADGSSGLYMRFIEAF